MCVLAVLIVVGLTLAPIAYVASPAGATSLGNVLILSTSVTGGSASVEAAAVTADGYTPVVDTGTTWDSLTQSQFSSYSAIILGDPTCSTSASTAIGAAVTDASTWSPAITGNVIVAGASPVAAAGGANPSGATRLTDDAVAYALASGSGKTGLYVSLSCYYAAASSGTAVPVLSGLGTFTVGGSVASTDSGSVNVPVEDGAPAFLGMTNASLLGWSASVQETFGSWPSNYQVLALDHSATPSDFSGPGGLTGRPYVLINNATSPPSFAGAVGGDLPISATFGESNPAAPGVTSGIATVGAGVNAATGDVSLSASDASASTYGRGLAVKRTYDSSLAQAQTLTGKSGIFGFGYGWSSSLGASVGLDSPTPGDIYTASSGLSLPQGDTVDASGNLYIADGGHNEVKELAASSHTQWGISMTAGSTYVIAGTGVGGGGGDGGAATSAQLNGPAGVAVDAAGNLYIADPNNVRIQEIAAVTGTQWGVSMTAGDIYTVAGTTGSLGCTTDPAGTGKTPTTNLMKTAENVAVDANGNLYIAASGNNRVLEISKGTDTQWGISMTAGDLYLVAGNSGCSYGASGNGGAATSARLNDPSGLAFDSSGDMYISDTYNNRIQEVPSTSGTQWGIAMTADDIYTVAGSSSGTWGGSGNGGAASSALLALPQSIVLDSAGDLFVVENGNEDVRVMAAASRTQWGTAMTAGDIYAVAGAPNPFNGSAGDGGPATSALLYQPQGLASDSHGNLYVADTGNNEVREVVSSTPTSFPLSPTPSGVTVNQGDGAQVTFIPPTSGSCPSPYVGPGTTGTYCAAPYVTATLTYSSTTGSYTFTTHDPYVSYTFNGYGLLTGETTAGGASLTVAYGSPTPGSGSCPSTAASCYTVTAASGRSIVFGLNSQNLVTSTTDPLGNRWTYAYSSGNLTTVTDPMSRVTSYTYDGSNSNPLLAHDLLTDTAPNGQSGGTHAGSKLQNTYDTAGRVTGQSDADGNSTSIYYGFMNEQLGNGVTIATDPDGNASDYTFATGVLDAKQIGLNTSAPAFTYYTPSTTTLLDTSVLDPDGGTTSYTYNANGDVLTTTNQLGKVTTKSYNSFDEETCSTKPLASSSCASLSPPSAVSPGAAVTPPSSAPPAFVTYTLYDTSGNQLWQTTGVYQPGGSTASYSKTTYNLYNGNSVTIGTANTTCGATPPSTALPCATIDANANVTQLVYNSSGDVTSSAIPDGNGTELATTTNAYDADGNQTSTTAPAGNVSGATAANYTTTTTYDADHEALVATLAGGTGSTIVPTVNATYYDPNGNTVATTGPLGNPYSSANPSGCNPNTTSTCSDTTYNAFDAANNQTLVQDPSGNQTLSCYDGDGNIAQTVPPSGVSASSLTPSSCPTSYPSGYSGTPLASDATMTTFNAQGKQTVVTAPPSTGGSTRVTTTNTYDPAGQLIETVAPPSAGTGSSNQLITTTFDLAGQTTTMTTGFGTSSSSTSSDCYDPDGDKTATVPGLGNASGVVACGTSSPWTTSSPYQTTSSYDSVGEPVSAVSPPPASQTSNATASSTYDANGNVLSSTDANGVVTTNTYSPLNKVVSSTTSSANSTNYYDANGNVVATTTPDGNPFSPSNPTGCNPLTTSTCSYTTYNTYNSSNELTVSAMPNNQTNTYYYDLQGNKVAMTGPGGNPSTCNPTTSSTPCADSITYVYNNLSQLTCMGQDNAANNTCASPGTGAGITTYTYTADGKRSTMVDATGTTNYYYDSSDRVISVSNGAGASVTYGYGQNSDPTCISYPNASNNTCTSPGSGTGVVTYAYNTANRLTSMTDWAGNSFALTYNANGGVSNLSANSGAVGVATVYDSANNVSSLDATASSGSATLLDLVYTRQPNGFISSEIPQAGSTIMGTKNYAYNALNRVTSGPIIGSTGSSAYAYSAGGNMTQSTNNYASAQYNQLGELCWTLNGSSSNSCASPPTGATTYSWLNGQRVGTATSSTNATYGWNTAMGTLACANTSGTTCSTTSPTSTTSVYTYNSDGLRATSVLNGSTNNYTWDPTTSTPRDLSDGTWDYLYLPGSNVPVEQVAASGSSPTADLLLADANSNVRGIVQLSSGAHQNQLVNYTDYDAFGNPITQSGGSSETGGLTLPQTSINSNYVGTTPFGFGGGYTDPTGLVYLVNRYYDPASAHFMSIDPMVLQTQQSFYYANDDPVNQTDNNGDSSHVIYTVSWQRSISIGNWLLAGFPAADVIPWPWNLIVALFGWFVGARFWFCGLAGFSTRTYARKLRFKTCQLVVYTISYWIVDTYIPYNFDVLALR